MHLETNPATRISSPLPPKKPVRSEGLTLLAKAPDDLLNASEVASMLSVDISWVNNHCTRVEPFIPHIKLGGGRYATRRFKKELILQFIDDHLITRLKRA
jgi:hypothetical protein